MKRRSSEYRKVWKEHNGPIPRDDNGVSYEIHHVDCDPSNNDISNLICIPIEEHFHTHYDRGEFFACALISKRMETTPEQRNRISQAIAASNRARRNPMENPVHRAAVSSALKGKYVGEKHHGFGLKRPEHAAFMKGIEFGKTKTDEQIAKHKISWAAATKDKPIRAKQWVLSYEGSALTIFNLKRFCREHGASYGRLTKGLPSNGYSLAPH